EIRSSDFSVNTLIPYINYQLSIPNQDMKCTLSGNYLLVVYEGDDEEDRLPVISRRFMIFENIVSVSVNKRRPFEVLKIDSHQEFDLFVSNKDFNIVNAQKSVSVDVLQNYRWDTAIKNLKPKFVIGDKMTINNTGKVSFPALKEYRPIDIRSFEIRAIGINSIDLNDYNTNVLLDLGRVRRDSHFSNVLDANGQFVIQNRDIGSDRTGGDYANVVFALESDKLEEDVYIMGAFTGWYPEEEFKMRYDDQRGVYIGDVLLKQGFYDFHYGILQNNVLNAQPIEGSWSETTNVYQVLVYLREPADQYDRIIGYYEFNSF
ncbi:MAG: type IX secretion system plug protein domain-containing protein, partial [Saprospiraceae bacterium]